jgi:serine protease DegQ
MLSRRRLLLVLVALLAIMLTGCGEGGAGLDAGDAGASRRGGGWDEIPAIVRDVEPSVVAVLSRRGDGEGQGSGVIVRPNGLIVTNAHVVEGAGALEVAFASGDREPAELIAADPRVDLALLRIARDDLPAARFADRTPVVGELAIAVGNPLGFENSVTAGVVSGVNRSIPSGGLTPALVDLVQTDAAISPGNSGGALVGRDRRVIGLNVAYIPPQARAVSIGFAIPAQRVVDAVEELRSEGEVREAFLGVVMTPLSPEIAQQFGIDAEGGAIVVDVARGSPADRAGIAPGDLIVRVNGRPVEAVEQVLGALRRSREGDTLRITVIRGGARLEVPVRVEER